MPGKGGALRIFKLLLSCILQLKNLANAVKSSLLSWDRPCRALWLVTPGHDTIDALLQRREQPQQQPPET
jgi:hypothetical protein